MSPATLEPASPVPLYHQLEQLLVQRIEAGHYQEGLPPELQLVAEFGVSRGTVRQALDRLSRRGVIIRRRGRGSFVAPLPLEYPLGRFYSFAHEMSERGIPESSRVLALGLAPTPKHVAGRLKMRSGTQSVCVVRLRLAGDRPLLLETSYLPEGLAPTLLQADLTHGSIYDALGRDGVRLTRVTEQVHAVLLDADQAAPFGLDPGAPALALERLTWAGDRPAEHRLVLAPSDRVTLTASWGTDTEQS